ncbi:MAG TPA: T9SS type A sorting domain-containing protein, partial [Ignavibacteriales bacterium]|nr:T9SS type A sorting domain-containing protein [Ignavibacteriales bacterium]
KRIFNVLIENELKISGLDIFAKVGSNTAYTYQCEIPQTADGFIDIKFAALNAGGSKISAIEVVPIDKITDSDWSAVLTVAKSQVGSKQLTFGQAKTATTGLDGALGEAILPPSPPDENAFDARLIFADNVSASMKDIRPLTDTTITWNVKLSGTPPYTLSWDPASLPATDVYLVDKINGSLVRIDMKATSSATISLDLDGLYIKMASKAHVAKLGLKKGWNIVSMPVKTEDMTPSSLFSESKASDVFEYNNGYVSASVMEVGRGYWVNMNEETELTLMGEKSNDSIEVKQGWNLIGFSDNVNASKVVSEPAGIITSDLYNFSNGYMLADSVKCGKGYWVKVSQDGKLLLGNTAAKATAIPKKTVIDDTWGVISISDADNNSTNLYLAEGSQFDGDQYELPPVPPAGIFDARFSGGKMISEAGKTNDIHLSGMTYPIKIKVTGININISDKFDGQIVKSALSSGQEISISSPLETLEISGEVIPLSYELKQNYPNPFNPTTRIAFTLPNPGNVKITVYNSLGQQVSELLNEQLGAGSHNVEFNAAGMASGVYFYKIESGSFSNIKKMMLLK